MSSTVFLGNLPTWVTADDIKSWLTAEGLVADSIKVIRNPETQESKGFAFIEAPNGEEMQSIIRRFDRAPLEDRLLRANPAQPPKSKLGPGATKSAPVSPNASAQPQGQPQDRRSTGERPNGANRASDRGGRTRGGARRSNTPQSAFAEELAKAL